MLLLLMALYGAGRIMSRTTARERLDVDEYRREIPFREQKSVPKVNAKLRRV